MNFFDPLRLGVQVVAEAVKLATAVPRAILNVVSEVVGSDDERSTPTAHQVGTPVRDARGAGAAGPVPAPTPVPDPAGPARGATGRRPASPRAGRGRAATREASVETTAAPPEPTSAAGASGGVAGTADAPQDAATAGAPDPTAATSTEDRPVAPQGERLPTQTRATPTPREKTVDDSSTLAETEGAATPSAQIRVDEPWTGYDKMRATEIVGRVKESDDAAKAVVRLYEQMHKKRKSVLQATGT
jgi:hypothetical protein